MKVSLIIAVYKDLEVLKLILELLEKQTYKNFEVIIAEDDDSKDIKEYIKNITFSYIIKHFSHEDKGLRKAISINESIKISEGEYLIFIDGDILPFTTFIESHVELAEDGKVLSGRRVNLGSKVSKALRERQLYVNEIEHKYIQNYFLLNDDNIRHFTKGIHVKPNGILYKILALFDNNLSLLGSNYSCFKKDMLKINGIDEDMLGGPAVDDTDIQWRLEAIGLKLKTCKYSANLFHLDHPRSDRREEHIKNIKIIEKKKLNNEYRCKNGILKE